MRKTGFFGIFLSLFCIGAFTISSFGSSMMNGSAQYATDAFPGFDLEKASPIEKKSPRWFSWWNGPKCDNASDQLKYALSLSSEHDWSAAAKAYDALVREWPASNEAALAQKSYADILYEKELDFEAAFAEYKYLLDFYSSSCDYEVVARRLFDAARMMREEGKRVLFVRFANTIDVRQAFEAVVLRAPSAPYAPEAMLTIAQLREDEGEYSEAILVYENLRNLFSSSPEAKTATMREARARMLVLQRHTYNRSRCEDTLRFLKMVRETTRLDEDELDEILSFITEVSALVENEAYLSAKFYDSRTRTKKSAVNAYEKFLKENPNSVHASEVRARLEQLKESK